MTYITITTPRMFRGVFLMGERGQIMPSNEVEEMKEFMNTLTEVKVSLAELNTKVDQIMDMKDTVYKTSETANEANDRSKRNEEKIKDMENDRKKQWLAILSIVGGFVLQLIYFLLTLKIGG